MEKGGSVGPLESKFFSTLHGSLWFGKDKGSIMESAESGGTIHLEINFSSNKGDSLTAQSCRAIL